MFQHVHGHSRLAAELARTAAIRRRRSPTGMRQNTLEPAPRGRPSLLGLQSTAYSRTTEFEGAGDVPLLLDVLPNETRSGVAPAANAISISATEAVSKQERAWPTGKHLRRRVRLHGVEHARVGQSLGEGSVVCRGRRRDRREQGPSRSGYARIRECALSWRILPAQERLLALDFRGLGAC